MYEATDQASRARTTTGSPHPARPRCRVDDRRPRLRLHPACRRLGRHRRRRPHRARALEEYERRWCNLATIHAACETTAPPSASTSNTTAPARRPEDRLRPVSCWGERGVVNRLFDARRWRAVQRPRRGRTDAARPGTSHPEEMPAQNGGRIARFFTRGLVPRKGRPVPAIQHAPHPEGGATCTAWLDRIDQFGPVRYLVGAGQCGVACCSSASPGLASARAALSMLLFLFLVGLGWRETRQPFVGPAQLPGHRHIRFLLEFVRPEIRQYFIESDTDSSRVLRARSACWVPAPPGRIGQAPFGTQLDVHAAGLRVDQPLDLAHRAGTGFRGHHRRRRRQLHPAIPAPASSTSRR